MNEKFSLFCRLTPAADVWGLGIMLYQLVSGLHPYSSVAGGRNSKLAALKSFVPVQLPDLPDIPGLRYSCQFGFICAMSGYYIIPAGKQPPSLKLCGWWKEQQLGCSQELCTGPAP